MRILWLGNPPFVPSGYGEQAALFIPRLQALGHQMAVAANWGVQGWTHNWRGLTVYPSDGDWGNTSTGTYAREHQADLVIALCDAWTLHPDLWPDDLRMAVWAPIDHHPIPPLVRLALADEKVSPIAMSRYGEEQMRAFGLDPVYVPHGVDTQVFRPMPELREKVREGLQVPQDGFLVGMVAANKSTPEQDRKSFGQSFHAFARFAKDHPDAFLYVHSEAKPALGRGVDLEILAKAVGCPQDRVIFPAPDQWHLGMQREVVAWLYQAMDVLLNPSRGEGFGIPILEAQACGVPVVASDHSSMTELVKETGYLVSGDPLWDALQTAFWIIPSIASIHEQLENAYDERDNQELRAQAVEFARGYEADLVTREHWQPALEKLAQPREAAPLALNGNRAQRRKAKRQKVKA